MNKKGFTLVELLATIAIIGILMGISISAVSRYINKAKLETEDDMTETVKKTTISYLQENKNLVPKEDGSYTDIYVTELYNNNLLTEKLVNGNKEDCMDGSYTRVTKISEDKYKYDVYLYCAGRLITNEVSSNKPEIGNFRFINLDDIDNMSFTFSLFISSKEDFIEEYSYIIYSKINSDGSYEEVYNSGTISGDNQSSINNTIKVKDKVDFINNNRLQVKVTVKSSSGIVNTKTITAK